MTVLLPDPVPRPIAVPVISVDDHLIEPVDLFVGRVPARLLRQRPAGGRNRRGGAVLALRRPDVPEHRAQRRGRPGQGDMEHGPVALRRDASGLLRHPRPDLGHGHQRDLGLAVLPVSRGRILRRRVLAGGGPRARSGLHAGLERLASRRVGRHLSRADHPAAAALAGRCHRGQRRGQGQCRARLQSGELPRVPGRARIPVHLLRRMGPVLRRLRGDADRRLSAHGSVVVGAAALTGPALRAAARRSSR